jgi:hypothetical protein
VIRVEQLLLALNDLGYWIESENREAELSILVEHVLRYAVTVITPHESLAMLKLAPSEVV